MNYWQNVMAVFNRVLDVEHDMNLQDLKEQEFSEPLFSDEWLEICEYLNPKL